MSAYLDSSHHIQHTLKMTLNHKIVTVFGGTGFIGTQVVRELASRGVTVKVATRVPESAYALRPCGAVGQIVPVVCDYNDPNSIGSAVWGSDFVVNCIGILFERGKRQTFQHAHIQIPETIARESHKANVKRLVHISSLACERGTSKYAQSKHDGEIAVMNQFHDAVILRPSVVFGENDEFFNMFARMTQILPSFVPLPLIGGGVTKFQPVFVGDVADAVMAGLYDTKTSGHIYELGGPETFNFKDIYELLFTYIHRRQPLMSVPFWAAKIQAFFMGVLPKPLLTQDQVESLKTDNVMNDDALNLSDLGVQTTAMDSILPTYLDYYRPGGRFAALDILRQTS